MTTQVCIRCRRMIDPAEMPNAIYGVEQKGVSGFSKSGAKEYADGRRGWLHASCFSVPAYRQQAPPDTQ